MLRSLGLFLAGLIVSSTLVLPASAEQVAAVYEGLSTQAPVHIQRGSEPFHWVYAGEMSLALDGESYPAYCIDLDHSINAGATYTADVYPLPAEEPYCSMGYILDNYEAVDDVSGAVIQVALWKLLYADEGLYAEPTSLIPDIDDRSNALVDEAAGNCGFGCDDVALDVDLAAGDAVGYLAGTVTLTRAGMPVVGQEVELSVSGGAIVEAGPYVTDATGAISVSVDVAGAALPLTLSAVAGGQQLYAVDPEPAYQQLLSVFYGDPCTFTAEDSFAADAFGDPRTIGFWKHQIKVWDSGKGHAHVAAATLESWLPIEVFDATVDSLDAMYDTLWLKNAPMQERAIQQCLATALNVAYGELGAYSPIDLDEDGLEDGYLYDFLTDAADAYDAGDFEYAKDICDGINNL